MATPRLISNFVPNLKQSSDLVREQGPDLWARRTEAPVTWLAYSPTQWPSRSPARSSVLACRAWSWLALAFLAGGGGVAVQHRLSL